MTDGAAMSIGEVSERSGTPATTLRYYERVGLIDAPPRVSGQRRYDASVLQRLMLIRFCRIAGLSLDDVQVVIADRSPDRAVTRQMAARQLLHIDGQIDELSLARRMMAAVIECRCPDIDLCRCGAMDAVVAELRDRLG